MKLNGNPTALTILKAGGKVILPSGYELHGDPRDGYIKEVNIGGGDDGLLPLSRKGLEQALDDADNDEEGR